MHSDMETLPDDIPQLKGWSYLFRGKAPLRDRDKLLREQVSSHEIEAVRPQDGELPSAGEAIQEILLIDLPMRLMPKKYNPSRDRSSAHTRRKSAASHYLQICRD